MCGRFTSLLSPELVAVIYKLAEAPQQLQIRYNIAPSQQIAVVRQAADGQNRLDIMRWGFIPSWAKDPKMFHHDLINAKSETVAEKPTFRSAIRNHRCLIPSSGFYEWKPTGDHKNPYLIKMRDDSPMTFAGIWDTWKTTDGQLQETCAILTTSTETNPLMCGIHERMPVILHPSEFDLWLDREMSDPVKLKPLYKPYPADLLEAYSVSTTVNNAHHDAPDCIARV